MSVQTRVCRRIVVRGELTYTLITRKKRHMTELIARTALQKIVNNYRATGCVVLPGFLVDQELNLLRQVHKLPLCDKHQGI